MRRGLIWPACAVALGVAALARAQWVTVDPAFPAGSGPEDVVRTIAVQPDGRVLIGGYFTNVSGVAQPYFARLNTNGTVDVSFAPQLDRDPTTIQPLADGRILISGAFTNVDGAPRPGLARLLGDGSLDTNFVPPAVPVSAGGLTGMAAPGGEVFVTGNFTTLAGVPANHLARLLDTGAVDPAFQSPFSPTDTVSVIAVQSDGQPLVSASVWNSSGAMTTRLLRLNLDGSVDDSYQAGLQPDERVLSSRASLLLPDDSLVAAVRQVSTNTGYPVFTGFAPYLVRLDANGTRDSSFRVSFNFPGLPFGASVYDLARQPDGKILVSGTFLQVNGTPRGRIARLEPDGTLDYCFDVALSDDLFALAIASEPDGGVVVGGLFAGVQGQLHPNLLRLLPPTNCAPGVIEMAVPALQAREDESRVVVPVVRRGGADLAQTVEFATLDGSARAGVDYDAVSGTVQFAPGERSQFISIPLRHDNATDGPQTFQVLLTAAGGGASLGALTNAVVTLTDFPPGTAGAPDTNFVVQLDSPVQQILSLTNGETIIAGLFTNVDGQFCPNLARLHSDGSRDPGLTLTAPLDGIVESLAVDAAGRLLVAGYFQRVDGVWRPGLARFDADGSLDSSFAPFDRWPTNAGGAVEISAVTVLADGSIVCSGAAPTGNAIYGWQNILLKFSPSGEIDPAFLNPMSSAVIATALTPLPDGGFYLAGDGLGNSLVRLRADGLLDLGFVPPADKQFTYYPGYVSPPGVLPDGRVVVGGSANFYSGLPNQPPLWRLNPDGSLDAGFALQPAYGSWGALESVAAFSASADGSVVVAGTFSNLASASPTLARLHADGSSDLSFDPGTGLQPRPTSGAVGVGVDALQAVPGGGWLLGGDFGSYDGFRQPYLVKILPETLSRPLAFQFAVTNLTAPGTNGSLTLEVRRSGDASNPATVTVFTQDGSATAGVDYEALDTNLTFAPGEWSQTVTVNILDNRAVEGAERFTVALANPTGGFTLGSPSAVTVNLQNIYTGVQFTADQFHAVQQDGFALASVSWSGALSTNGQAVVKIVPVTGEADELGVSSLVLTERGATNWFRIPLVDSPRHGPTREFQLELFASGNVIPGPRTNALLLVDDVNFPTVPARGVAGVVEALANAPGGGVYLGGDFTGVNGVPLNNVARLLPDGNVDPDFNPGAGPNGDVSALAVQPADGKILIAGNFTAVDGVPRAGLARLETDGSLDASFDPGAGAQNTNGAPFIQTIVPESDGRIYLAGAFTHFDGHYSYLVAELQTNGAVDGTFVSPFAPAPSLFPPPPWPILPTPLVARTNIQASAITALEAQSDGGFVAAVTTPAQMIIKWPGIYSVTGNSLVRFGPNGQLDASFGTNAGAALRAPCNALAISANGEILVGAQVGTSASGSGAGISTNWLAVFQFTTNGQRDASFRVRNAPAVAFTLSRLRQLLVQPDGRILFSADIFTNIAAPPFSTVSVLAETVIGRLLADGTWDSSFQSLNCSLPLLGEPGPFWFNFPPSSLNRSASASPRWAPTVSLARQPDGVLVLAGAFDAVNGEPRHRLARVDADGSVRGRLVLNLLGGPSPQLVLPPEVETPYMIQTSTDLVHWSDWLYDGYPWWPFELSVPPDGPARFFRAQAAR